MSISSLFINLAGFQRRCLIIGRSLATNAANNKASLEQLTTLERDLASELPKFFSRPPNYNAYSRDILFIDNIRNIRTEGITKYILQLQMIKLYHNLRYTSIRVELLNLVKNPEESYLRIRWRIVSKPGLLKMLMFLVTPKQLEDWKDGISTMHVNKDGKIYCHVCDNIDVDANDRVEEKKASPVKNPLVGGGLSVCNKPRV